MDVPEAESPTGEETVSVRTIVEKPDRLNPPEAKSGPPSLDEWEDFFARFVIRIMVDFYLMMVLGDDLMNELTPMEAKQIALSKEDMRDIAAPLASMSNKSRFMKKHGRSIIATADSYESVITLMLWMRRVNRIAKKHRPPKAKKTRTVSGVSVPNPPAREESNNAFDDGYSGGEVAGAPINGYGFFNPGSGG